MRRESCKISVVIPIYKVEKYVRHCILSVIEQTYKDIEIILVVKDFGDKCVSICQEYKKSDKRIKIIYQNGKGLVNARQEGTLAATGDYILNVDGDDWIEKDRIQNLVDFIHLTNADMIHLSGHLKEYEDKRVVVEEQVKKGFFSGEDVFERVFPLFRNFDIVADSKMRWGMWNWAIRRSLMVERELLIDDKIYYGEDAIGVFMCLLKAKSVAIMEERGYHYIVRHDSGKETEYTIKNTGIDLWHEQLKYYFKEKQVPPYLYRGIFTIAIFGMLLYDTEKVMFKWNENLFPYTKVKLGSCVVIYGAGRFGKRLYDILHLDDRYKVVLWVDQNALQMDQKGNIIKPVEKILEVKYDYVILAALTKTGVVQMKRKLLDIGVEGNKIAEIDEDAFHEDDPPWLWK